MRYFFILFLTFIYCEQIYGQGTQSIEISFTHDSLRVFGTLVKPIHTNKRLPVIIIAPGSGQNDRDGTFPMIGENIKCLYPGLEGDTLNPYKELSEALAKAGYAVLRYEKLEYTYKPKTLGHITFYKLWLPLMSAIDYLKTRPDIDTNKIVLAGHSEGSSIIAYVASKRHDIQALMSIAGAHTTFDSLFASQIQYISQICSCHDTAQASFQANFILNYYNHVRKREWKAMKLPSLFGAAPEIWYDYLAVTDSTSYYYNEANKPTLFIGFDNDINVPVKTELNSFKKDIKTKSDFVEIPNLIHYMVAPDNPHISPALVEVIINWLNKYVPPNN